MIDREKVISDLRRFINYPEPLSGTVKDALELLKEPVIVRCKDCKYYRYYGPDSYISSECTLKFTDGPIPTWFCAGGERR